jgi:hypothetical protein
MSVLLGFAAILAGCATTKGELYSDVQKADATATATVTSAPLPSAEKPTKGIRIVTDPPGAIVSIGLQVLGLTPLVLEDIQAGSYRILIHKNGYRTVAVWLDYDGTPLVYAAALQEVTGFLQVNTDPADAQVLVEGTELPTAGTRVRVGSYEITVRAFGYEEHTERVEVREDALTSLKVSLRRTAFAFSSLDASRAAFSPENYGNLGTTRIFFRVTGPGSAELRILSADGAEVLRRDFPSLDSWDHEVIWDGRDATAAPLGDGQYRVVLDGRGPDGAAVPPKELALRIDRSAAISYRSLVSGSAGLMYAPTPEVLPKGSLQFSVLAVAHAEVGGDPATFRVPTALGLRAGLGIGEIDVEAGSYFSSAVAPGSVPLFASLSARYAYARPVRGLGFGGAVGVRVAYHALTTDTLTNYTGIALCAPLRFLARPVSLILAPELIASYTRVSYAAPPVSPAFWLWGYCRAGVLLDVGPLVLGVSTALRLAPFSEGLAISLPLPVAAEIHFTIPGTQVVLSAVFAAEIASLVDYYVMAGGGFGFLQ